MEYMELPMQCRLCLCSAPAEAFVSIHEDPLEPLAKRISSCCRLQVEKGDRLPDTICRSCNTNLDLLISFRKVCLQSDEISKMKLNKPVTIKHEEVLLEDLIWENEIDVSSPRNVCNATVNDELNEWKLSTSAPTDSSPQIHSIENINSQICGANTLSKCDIRLKSCSRKSYLNNLPKILPKNLNTEEQPYQCDICLKRFALKQHLATHWRTQTESTPKSLFKTSHNMTIRIETEEQRENRLKLRRQRYKIYKKKETPEIRQQRLECARNNREKANEKETPEQRELRLKLKREYNKKKTETLDERNVRLKAKRERARMSRAEETEEERNVRLKVSRERVRMSRAEETEEERNVRLKGLRERVRIKRQKKNEMFD
ncbi:uncharacterized protein LOC143921487 [Arctopsyche grandis]|uniref:uncharacterized protein LOC143921487 n=1 Tax=Arctopsyche grandis TaxID=121162 RepID=UPI00406D964C